MNEPRNDDHASRLTLTDQCPEYVLVQYHGTDDPADSHDYSRFGSRDAAWEAEKNEEWVRGSGMTPENCRHEFMDTLIETDREGVLQAAQAGDRWPIASGFVREVSELEVLQEENRRLRTKFGAAQEQIVALRAALEDARTSWAMEVAELRDGNDIVSETDSAGGWGAASDLENALDDRRPGNRNPSPH